MTARITRADAKRLGVPVPTSTRAPRTTARGGYHTRCHACGEAFTTVAAEDRHVAVAGRHVRFDLVLAKR